jgi:hypothetical protein
VSVLPRNPSFSTMTEFLRTQISSFELGCDPNVDYKVVPIDSIIEPLLVFGKSPGCTNEYCCALPKRKWGRYFGERIEIS